MQSTTSVSEGCFLSLPKDFNLTKLKKGKKRKLEDKNEEPWLKTFNKVWTSAESDIKDITKETYSKVLEDITIHMKKLYKETYPGQGILPCEVLLAGSNIPDHNLLFSALLDKIHSQVTSYVATLWSRDCPNIKHTVRHLVQQIIPIKIDKSSDSDEDEQDDLLGLMEEISPTKVKLQAGQYHLGTLAAWYNNLVKDKTRQPVVIILPDFESFPAPVLAHFIQILSSYQPRVPWILVFGVATTAATVHQNLPRHVLSQVALELFHSEPSTVFLNTIIEKVFFSEKLPFRLGSRCMTFLTDVFLFNAFSVHRFIQGIKYCMMEHYFKKNYMVLCCHPDSIQRQLSLLQAADMDNIRKLPSFQRHVEQSPKEDRKLLLLDDAHTKTVIADFLKELHDYTSNFHVMLIALHIITSDIPQSPLGKHAREYYCKAVSSSLQDLTEFKETMKLLRLQSLMELKGKIKSMLDLIRITSIVDILSLDKTTKLDDVIVNLEKYQRQLDLIESTLENQLQDDKVDFESTRKSFLEYIETEVVGKLLQPPAQLPLHELLYYDDLVAVRRRLSGAPRGAIHMGLNNPHYYLQCECCKLPEPGSVLPTMPDLSIAYKLHLECNKMINLYDWLQAFAATVNPHGVKEKEEEGDIDKEMQARFTRAVSELQFLGFIKPSRAKADHVSRLTWGNT